MKTFCAMVEETEWMAYLEIDKRENVHFYEKHG